MSKEIKIFRASYDKDNKLTKEPIGFMPVLKDAVKREYTALDIESMRVRELYYNEFTGDFQAKISIGAYDADGNFHEAPGKQAVLWRLTKHSAVALWAKYVKDRESFSFDEIVDWAHAEGLLPSFCKVWEIDGIEYIASQKLDEAPVLPDALKPQAPKEPKEFDGPEKKRS